MRLALQFHNVLIYVLLGAAAILLVLETEKLVRRWLVRQSTLARRTPGP